MLATVVTDAPPVRATARRIDATVAEVAASAFAIERASVATVVTVALMVRA